MAIRYKNPQTGEYEVIKIPVMKGEQGHAGIHVGTDAPPTTDVKLWFDPSDTDNDVDLANRLDTTLTACYDYMGNDRGSIKAAADANVDWLLGEINTVHYDGQHITATDTIEGRSKSAILSGNTLVNIVNNDNWVRGTDRDRNLFIQNISIKKGQTYTVIGKMESSDVIDESGDASAFRIRTGTNNSGTSLLFIQQSDIVFKQTFTNNENDTIHLRFFNQKTNYKKLMIIEGDYTNVDIPYFEGMQSVQMPGLKTTGKNLFNLDDNLHCLNRLDNGRYHCASYKAFSVPKLKPNTAYTLSFSVSEFIDKTLQFPQIHYTDGSVQVSYRAYGTFNGNPAFIMKSDPDKTISHFNFSYGTNDERLEFIDFQIEEGNISTSYEPYQSNILTVNEDVTLRGIGDVQDTLDCLTGEVVERIGEIVLDGSEKWVISQFTRPNHLRLYFTGSKFKQYQNVINSRFPDIGNIQNRDVEGVYITNTFDIQVEHSRLSEVSLDGFKQWLSQNPITVQYRLATESIKTVDLSDNHVYSYKDVTHYDCSSAEGSLVPTLSIDVPTNLSALVTKQRQQIRTLEEENKELNQELQLAITSSEENDNELLAQSFELDFRLMEVECALDLPMAATFRLGGKAMAMTPYEMAKKLILADNYDRADMEHKLEVYVSKKRMTEAERQELIQLMNEKEGIITTDPIEPEIEESDVEHEAVTIPLH